MTSTTSAHGACTLGLARRVFDAMRSVVAVFPAASAVLPAASAVLPAATAVLLAACGGGGDGAPTGGRGVASVTLDPSSVTLLVGRTEQLTATARDASGNAVAGAPLPTWSTSNNAVATVNTAGLVTAVAEGIADVTAAIAGRSATARVTVTQAPLLATVTMPGQTFSPARATVRRGGTVDFVFPALAHTVVFERLPGAPADIPVPTSGTTVSRRFDVVRLYQYACTVHGGMTGEVDVVP